MKKRSSNHPNALSRDNKNFLNYSVSWTETPDEKLKYQRKKEYRDFNEGETFNEPYKNNDGHFSKTIQQQRHKTQLNQILPEISEIFENE